MPERPEKPNCFECEYKHNIPGDVHVQCKHPKLETMRDQFTATRVMARDGMVRTGDNSFVVRGDKEGIRHSWFMWPLNFDPTWLRKCTGFKKKERNHEQARTS